MGAFVLGILRTDAFAPVLVVGVVGHSILLKINLQIRRGYLGLQCPVPVGAVRSVGIIAGVGVAASLGGLISLINKVHDGHDHRRP